MSKPPLNNQKLEMALFTGSYSWGFLKQTVERTNIKEINVLLLFVAGLKKCLSPPLLNKYQSIPYSV